MRNRWLIYSLVGLGFGFADWYFLALLASIGQNQALNESLLQAPQYVRLLIVVVLMTLNYGVWLIPAIPAAIYEMKLSHSLRRAAMSAIIVWSMALLSYYAYYAFLLMFVGLPNFDFMLFSNRHLATYWADWWPPFKRVIVDQFIGWIGIAFVGGALVGIASAYLSDFVAKRRRKSGAL
jgi:MFS family permease